MARHSASVTVRTPPQRSWLTRVPSLVAAIACALATTALPSCGPETSHLALQLEEVWPVRPNQHFEISYVLAGLLLDGWPAWEVEDLAGAASEALAQCTEPTPSSRLAYDDFELSPIEIRCSELLLDRGCEGAAPAYCDDAPPADAPAIRPVATARRGIWRVQTFELATCPRQLLHDEV